MNHLVLIGFMGSGKSTLAPILSEKFSLPIFCTDDEIEKQTNMSIGEIFKHFGEEFFRLKENEIFLQIKHLDSPHIIDCGGGFGAYQNVNELGKVIFLDVEFEEIERRLLADKKTKRPLFDTALKRRYLSRQKPYRTKADLIINQTERIDQIVKKIRDLANVPLLPSLPHQYKHK